MLFWSIAFFLLAVLAAVLGFGFLSSTFAVVAKVLFVLFLAFFVISLVSRAADSAA